MLDVKNLTKSFGAFKALDDLSMHIPEGAVYGLVGPNGAGKSTLIRCLTGVYRPDSGTVLMEGQRIFENPGIKSRIGYIPDDIFYFPSATMEDMRAYYRSTYPKFDNALFERLFEAFQLPRKSPIRRFSKGMQKQAAFQLAISTRPDVLILEGIHCFHDPRLCRLMYLKLYMNVEPDICLLRRIQRDIKDRGREIDGISMQYLATVKPMYDKYIRNYVNEADVIVARGGKNARIVDILAGYVQDELNKRAQA